MSARSGTRIAAVVSALLLLIAGGLIWHNFVAMRNAGAERDALVHAMKTNLREQASLEMQITAAAKRLEHMKSELKGIETDRAALPSSLRPGKVTKPPSSTIAHMIRNEPDAQVLFLESHRAGLRVTYGPLFRELRLSREQQAAFMANVIARDEKRMDLDNLAAEEGADDAAIAKLRTQTSDDYDAAQRELLGAEGAKRWREYERISSVRGMVSTIAGVTVLEGVPLSLSQADEVVRIIARSSSEFVKGGRASMETVDWAAAEPQIRAVLSPAQFEVFRTTDPGPTAGGLPQNLLYAEVDRANAAARAASAIKSATADVP